MFQQYIFRTLFDIITLYLITLVSLSMIGYSTIIHSCVFTRNSHNKWERINATYESISKERC